MHKVIMILMASSLLVTSCKDESTVHALFVDTTGSTATLESGNPEKIMQFVRDIWNQDVKSGEMLVIYPIHRQTATATPIGKWIKPAPSGDLNAKNKAKRATKKMILEVENALFNNPKITPIVRSETNLFPIFDKVKRLSNKGNVRVTIISDMIQDTPSLSFVSYFDKMNKVQIKKFATQKYNQFKDEILISGVVLEVLYPGTTKGNPIYETLMRKVNIFWETFFDEAGANAYFSDLS